MYYASMLVVGGLVGLNRLRTLFSGTTGVAPVVAAVGGLSLVAISIYQIGFTDDPAGSVPGQRAIRLMVLAAVLVVAGTLLRMV